MGKKSSKGVDIILDLLYSNITDPNPSTPYEKRILDIMVHEDATLREALELDIILNVYNSDSVVDIVEYLEENVIDLNKVSFLMNVYTGRAPDLRLKPI
jgi:hypothetical protein